jgi:peptidoglycan/xylan/chitin deacetylase (PgdA/CDA1 family)
MQGLWIWGATLLIGSAALARAPEGHDIGPMALDFQEFQITNSGLSGSRRLALTFDDGPTPATAKLLEALREEGVRATFFINGKRVPKRETILRSMQADGHVVANHTYSHPKLDGVYVKNPTLLVDEVWNTHQLIVDFMSVSHRKYFRAPFGIWRRDHARVLNRNPVLKEYIGPIFWDIGGEIRLNAKGHPMAAADWDCWGRGWAVERCLRGYLAETARRQGGVVLFHDVDERTVQLAVDFIRDRRAAGYDFITLDDVRAYDAYE